MNHVKANGRLWLVLGHVGMMECTRTGPTSLCEKKFSPSEKARNFFSCRGEGEKNFLT